MAKYNIQRNYYNGGWACIFKHNEQEYFADLCLVPFADYTECMIFKSEGGQLTMKNAKDLYCKRDIDVTKENLVACIEEFINELDSKGNGKGN